MWPVKIRSAFLKFTNMKQLSNLINVALAVLNIIVPMFYYLRFKNIKIINIKYKIYKVYTVLRAFCMNS